MSLVETLLAVVVVVLYVAAVASAVYLFRERG